MGFRFAIVGLGNAAQNIHIPAVRKLTGAACIGGFDERPPSNALPFPIYSSFSELLLEGKPDIVIIATPPKAHYELARQALASGCHVFCEKPVTETLKEADDLVAIAREKNRHVVVNSQFPWMPIHAAAKRRMGLPGFGELQFVSMHQTFVVTEDTERGWRAQEARRTLKDFGTHVLDLAMFFYGQSPRSVRARMPRPLGADRPDYLCLIELDFGGERYAHITLDRLSRGPHRYLDIRLDGSEATIESSIGGQLQTTVGVRPRTRRPFWSFEVAGGGRARLYRGETYETLATAPIDLFADATARLLREFLSAVEAGCQPPSGLSKARVTLELLLACYDSAEDGQPREIRQ